MQLERTVGVVATLAMLVVVAIAEWGEPINGWGFVFFNVALAVALFHFVVPRVLRGSLQTQLRLALTFSILSILLLAAFWFGLSLLFGPAAILLGREGQRSTEGVPKRHTSATTSYGSWGDSQCRWPDTSPSRMIKLTVSMSCRTTASMTMA